MTDWTPIHLPTRVGRPLVDRDIDDCELLEFALGFAEPEPVPPAAARLLAEFGDVDIILASEPEVLRHRGGLSIRAVAILKLLNAFRRNSRQTLLH